MGSRPLRQIVQTVQQVNDQDPELIRNQLVEWLSDFAYILFAKGPVIVHHLGGSTQPDPQFLDVWISPRPQSKKMMRFKLLI